MCRIRASVESVQSNDDALHPTRHHGLPSVVSHRSKYACQRRQTRLTARLLESDVSYCVMNIASSGYSLSFPIERGSHRPCPESSSPVAEVICSVGMTVPLSLPCFKDSTFFVLSKSFSCVVVRKMLEPSERWMCATWWSLNMPSYCHHYTRRSDDRIYCKAACGYDHQSQIALL